MKQFRELDVTQYGREHLAEIYTIVSCRGKGWFAGIENLEMIVSDGDRILVRCWTTQYKWWKLRRLLTSKLLCESLYNSDSTDNLQTMLSRILRAL